LAGRRFRQAGDHGDGIGPLRLDGFKALGSGFCDQSHLFPVSRQRPHVGCVHALIEKRIGDGGFWPAPLEHGRVFGKFSPPVTNEVESGHSSPRV